MEGGSNKYLRAIGQGGEKRAKRPSPWTERQIRDYLNSEEGKKDREELKKEIKRLYPDGKMKIKNSDGTEEEVPVNIKNVPIVTYAPVSLKSERQTEDFKKEEEKKKAKKESTEEEIFNQAQSDMKKDPKISSCEVKRKSDNLNKEVFFAPDYGKNLAKEIKAKKPNTQETISILKQIATQVGILHESGSIHGDLKPDNCLINENVVTVIDFSGCRDGLYGSLQWIDKASYNYYCNNIQSAKKDPTYKDRNALSVIAIELLSGIYPSFTCKKELEIMHKALSYPLEYLENVINGEPPTWGHVKNNQNSNVISEMALKTLGCIIKGVNNEAQENQEPDYYFDFYPMKEIVQNLEKLEIYLYEHPEEIKEEEKQPQQAYNLPTIEETKETETEENNIEMKEGCYKLEILDFPPDQCGLKEIKINGKTIKYNPAVDPFDGMQYYGDGFSEFEKLLDGYTEKKIFIIKGYNHQKKYHSAGIFNNNFVLQKGFTVSGFLEDLKKFADQTLLQNEEEKKKLPVIEEEDKSQKQSRKQSFQKENNNQKEMSKSKSSIQKLPQIQFSRKSPFDQQQKGKTNIADLLKPNPNPIIAPVNKQKTIYKSQKHLYLQGGLKTKQRPTNTKKYIEIIGKEIKLRQQNNQKTKFYR